MSEFANGTKSAANATLYRWSEMPNEQLNPLLSRQYVTGDQSMFARIVLKKGCIVPTHSHPNEQITFIAEGALKFVLGRPEGPFETHVVRPGETLVIPSNLPHSAEALEDTVDFDVFTPPRMDWINKTDSYLR